MSYIPNQQQTRYIKALTSVIPLNGYGLIEGIFRPDLLPELHCDNFLPGASTGTSTDTGTEVALLGSKYSPAAKALGLPQVVLDGIAHELDAAYVPLEYVEGFPTVAGKPFWLQLDFEPADAYIDFEDYLRQVKEEGIRQLYTLVNSDRPIEQLQEQAILYYWPQRALAYDTFNIIQRRKERERRALETENTHYMIANKLISLCEVYLENNLEELKETLSPKNFIEMLKTATQLQRISVGLPMNGPSATQAADPASGEGSSLEVIMRKIVQSNTAENNTALTTSEADTQREQLASLQSLMHDPETLKIAQELIVRVNK